MLDKFTQKHCTVHGETEFVLEKQKYYRCKKCRSERTIGIKKRHKRVLVAEFGSACNICGYNRHVGALHFHHINPTEKSFTIANACGIVKMREEAKKCILLCANCHSEVEAGVTKIL